MRAMAAAGVVAVVANLVAIVAPGGAAEPAPASAPARTWELLLLPGDWPAARPPQDHATAWPLLKQRARKPALVLRPAGAGGEGVGWCRGHDGDGRRPLLAATGRREGTAGAAAWRDGRVAALERRMQASQQEIARR